MIYGKNENMLVKVCLGHLNVVLHRRHAFIFVHSFFFNFDCSFFFILQ